MIVELPFLNRLVGHTPRDPEIRVLVARDKAEVEIPHRRFMAFDLGARLSSLARDGGGVETLELDGSHWASVGDGPLGARSKEVPLDKLGKGRLFSLMESLDTSMFFDAGRVRLNSRTTLRSTPPARMVAESQRERIFERLYEWAANNLLVVDGTLYTKVHEPSLVMTVTPKLDRTMTLEIKADRLLPWGSPLMTPGAHFRVDEHEAVVAQAEEMRRISGSSGFVFMIGNGTSLEAPSSEDMVERGIVATAWHIVRNQKPGTKNHDAIELRRLLCELERSSDDLNRDPFVEAMVDRFEGASRNLGPLVAAMAEMSVARWTDRPMVAPKVTTSRSP